MDTVSYILHLVGGILRWIVDLVAANLAGFFSALSGTFLGAYFAFLFERRERQSEAEAKDISALNRALWTISEMWSVLRQYQRDHLDEVRHLPDRWLNLTGNPLAARADVSFDAGPLYFLLVSEANTFANVMLQERRFRLAISVIEQRSRLVLTEVFPRMEDGRVPVGDQRPLAEVERILGTAVTHQLQQYTDQIFSFVDDNVPDFEVAFDQLRSAAKRLYPKGKFINFDFNSPPTAPSTTG